MSRGEKTTLPLAQAAYRAALLADLKTYAAVLDNPPKPVAVADLMAHLDDIYSDSRRAHRAARAVLDLGWRPAVPETK